MKKQGTGYLWAAGIVFVVGILVSLSLIFFTVSKSDENQKIVAPCTQQVLMLDKPGDYQIFYEYKSEVNGNTYFTDKNLSIQCQITEKITNAPIQVSLVSMNSSYQMGSREGKSLYKFSITNPGEYYISAKTDNPEYTDMFVLAIGQNSVLQFIGSTFLAIIIIFVTVIASIGLLMFGIFKRSKG